MRRTAAVVGGGVAGLTVAYRLVQKGWYVHLFEEREELGGLARSVGLGDGRIECYYHFICGGDGSLLAMIRELGLEGRLRWREAPVGQWYEGKLYPMSTALDLLRFRPLSVVDRVRVGLHAWRAQRLKDWSSLDQVTAKEWLLRTVGPRVYEVIWRPLLEDKFGPYHDRVSAAWLWHRLWRVGTSRRSAFRPDVMGYLEGGSEVLVTALAERTFGHRGEVHKPCAVAEVQVRDGRVCGVVTAGGEVEAEVVVLAVPLAVASRLIALALPQYSERLRSVPSMGVVCGLLRLNRHLTECFWVNVSDGRVPFNGFIEYSNLNPSAEVWGGEVVYVPVYLEPSDERFEWSDDKWVEFFKAGLAVVEPEVGELLSATVITRDKHAQPVCGTGFSGRVPPIAGPAPGLFLVEASQLYPSDRCLSGMIGLGNRAAELIEEGGRA